MSRGILQRPPRQLLPSQVETRLPFPGEDESMRFFDGTSN